MLPDSMRSGRVVGDVATTSVLPTWVTLVTLAASRLSSSITLPGANSPSGPESLEKV